MLIHSSFTKNTEVVYVRAAELYGKWNVDSSGFINNGVKGKASVPLVKTIWTFNKYGSYTNYIYKIVRRCEAIFCTDEEKNACVAGTTEGFLDEVWTEKSEQIGLFYKYNWYYNSSANNISGAYKLEGKKIILKMMGIDMDYTIDKLDAKKMVLMSIIGTGKSYDMRSVSYLTRVK